jgi:hypothetical protein
MSGHLGRSKTGQALATGLGCFAVECFLKVLAESGGGPVNLTLSASLPFLHPQ